MEGNETKKRIDVISLCLMAVLVLLVAAGIFYVVKYNSTKMDTEKPSDKLTEETVSSEETLYLEKVSEADGGEGVETTEAQEASTVTQERLEYYLSLEPECTDTGAEGVEYRMIPVDRACGSSYYVFLSVERDQVLTCNPDPYLGSGGAAKWVTFLEGGQLGFSCLAYSGGSYGSLYRTENGGKTFQYIEYPSAEVELSDGTIYNPFVMPERIYEEDGVLYMEAGQGPDGDYYGKMGFCSGLYESKDQGKTWIYIREIPEERE